ncbi:hypothetical protein [Paenibacillus campi]|uniref:hypothetical protein n=1 Tax=Paenibacillus campi TaxID=3106031 RepID=UPI002AFFF703|nr:hypothetical protein [Paenibacillus sp. SGZ-1009]
MNKRFTLPSVGANYRNSRSPRRRWTDGMMPIVLLLLIGIAIRIWLGGRYPGFIDDQRLFVQWMNDVGNYGLGKVYMNNGGINYPPVFLLIMQGYAGLLRLLGLQAMAGTLTYKSLLIMLDMLAFIVVAIWSRKAVQPRTRLPLLACFALNPVLIVNGAVWGQVDVLNGMLMAGSLLLLLSLPLAAGILFALALLTKLQAIVIAPVIGWYVLRCLRERRLRPVVLLIVGALLPSLVAGLYFAGHGGLNSMIRGAYLSAVGMYTQVTLNALNIWYYLVGVAPDTNDTTRLLGIITLRHIGLSLLIVAVLYSGWYMLRIRKLDTAAVMKAGVWLCFAFFMLPTEIHERYSVPALIVLLFVAMLDSRWIVLALLLSVTITYNLWSVMMSTLTPAPGIVVACLHVLAFAWMGWRLWREKKAGDVSTGQTKGWRRR